MFANGIGEYTKDIHLPPSCVMARALADTLQKVGLLLPCNLEQLPFTYAMYYTNSLKLSAQFQWTLYPRKVGVCRVVRSVDWTSISYLRAGTP